MDIRKLSLIALVAACVGCATAPPPAPAPDTTAQDQAAIKAIEDKFTAAFNAKDTNAIMSLYVPDQSLIVFDAAVPRQYTGAAAYTKDWNDFWAMYPGPAKIDLSDLDITVWRQRCLQSQHPARHADGQERQENGVHRSHDRWLQEGQRPMAHQPRARFRPRQLRHNETRPQLQVNAASPEHSNASVGALLLVISRRRYSTPIHRILIASINARSQAAHALQSTNSSFPSLARPSLWRVERNLHNSATLDADRRKNPARSHASHQPLLGSYALPHRARPHHLAHALRQPHSADRLRFCRPHAGGGDIRRRPQNLPAPAHDRVCVLPPGDVRPGKPRQRRFASGPCPSKSRTPFLSSKTMCTRTTTRNTRSASGASCSKPTRVFTAFRSRFRGKVSPVHLFWGALDLACTRFSGRTAPEHPSMPGLADRVTRDAYSHEVQQLRILARHARAVEPLFSATPIPSRPATGSTPSPPPRPASIRTSANSFCPMKPCASRPIPTPPCLNFLQSTYEAAANSAHWDRTALDCA